MHPRIAEVLQHLDHHRGALRAAVDRVPRADRERRPSADRWSVAEVLQHLALVEGRLAQLFQARLAEARAKGLGPERETSPVVPSVDMRRIIDRSRPVTAGEGVQPRAQLDADAAWAKLEAARATMRAVLLDGDGLALGEIVHPNPVLGPLNLYQWVAFVGAHEARHRAQIEETAAALDTEREAVR